MYSFGSYKSVFIGEDLVPIIMQTLFQESCGMDLCSEVSPNDARLIISAYNQGLRDMAEGILNALDLKYGNHAEDEHETGNDA